MAEDAFDNPIAGTEQITPDNGIVSTNAPASVFSDDNSDVLFDDAGGF